MPLLTPLHVPRTSIRHHNPILYDSGRGRGLQAFYPPGHKYLGYEIVPPANKWTDGTPSFMSPQSHFHLLQTETFHVESGAGLWIFPAQNNKTAYLSAGQEITIPRFVAHRFENASETEPLVIKYRYDAQMYEMERKFFSNVLQYFWDCKKAGVEPSVLQVCVFLSEAWMPPDLFPWLLNDYLRCLVNTLLMWVLAIVGRVVYGYKGTYEEYYDENWTVGMPEEVGGK